MSVTLDFLDNVKAIYLLYDDAEPIEPGAALGVLPMARRIDPSIEAFAIAKNPGVINCANGLKTVAGFGFGLPAFAE